MIRKLGILVWFYGFFQNDLIVTTVAIFLCSIPAQYKFWKAFQVFYKENY